MFLQAPTIPDATRCRSSGGTSATRFKPTGNSRSPGLKTHGNRGCVFWVRLRGPYPKTVELKTHDGKHAGEFRSTGYQSIIWGIHPDTHRPYEFILKKPVVEVEFNSIKWPDKIKKYPQCTEEDASHSVSSVSSVPSVSSVSSVHGWTFQSELLRISFVVRCQQRGRRTTSSCFSWRGA